MGFSDDFCRDTRDQLTSLRERNAVLEAKLSNIEEKLDEHLEKFEELHKKLTKYEGRLGGLILGITAVVAFLKFVVLEGKTFFGNLFGG